MKTVGYLLLFIACVLIALVVNGCSINARDVGIDTKVKTNVEVANEKKKN